MAENVVVIILSRKGSAHLLIYGYRLSAIELFLSPLPAPGMTCHATSRPHHLCLFSEAV